MYRKKKPEAGFKPRIFFQTGFLSMEEKHYNRKKTLLQVFFAYTENELTVFERRVIVYYTTLAYIGTQTSI